MLIYQMGSIISGSIYKQLAQKDAFTNKPEIGSSILRNEVKVEQAQTLVSYSFGLGDQKC